MREWIRRRGYPAGLPNAKSPCSIMRTARRMAIASSGEWKKYLPFMRLMIMKRVRDVKVGGGDWRLENISAWFYAYT